jgi:hypothetical protein
MTQNRWLGHSAAVLAFCVLPQGTRGEQARVAEWQTRTVQVRVSVRTWEFKSPRAHKQSPKSAPAPGGDSQLSGPVLTLRYGC